MTATATLKHAPVGTATLKWSYPNQMLNVDIEMTGLAPGSTHPAHIHEGNCDKSGKVLYPLENLVADSHGVARATTKVTVPNGIPADGWSINVHNGPGTANEEENRPISCGNVTNQNTSAKSDQSAQVPLVAPDGDKADNDVSGTARLSIANKVLTVQMNLEDMAPKSEHTVHIHAGSCASQGAVVYDLPVIVADEAGKANVTATVSDVSSIPSKGWYINVHRSKDISTQTGFDPIACGDIVPGQP